eukprot:316326-Rhodomonas_salina.3
MSPHMRDILSRGMHAQVNAAGCLRPRDAMRGTDVGCALAVAHGAPRPVPPERGAFRARETCRHRHRCICKKNQKKKRRDMHRERRGVADGGWRLQSG